MITTQQITSIDADELLEWLTTSLAPHFPANTHIAIIPQAWEAKGESRFFSEIDINEPISLSVLMTRAHAEWSTANQVYFYAQDVVEAAVKAGELQGNHFWLYYEW